MAKEEKKSIQQYSHFPPVVTVLGHVDHGKTTLLDTIRKTSIAQKEHGGITQRIGASRIEVNHEGSLRKITFIDTPGHEAFAKMRSRGAQAADIGILVVASTDGVMPQTKESIQLLQSSNIPFIVALTKADMEGKNVEKVKQQLLNERVMLEGLGGDVPYIEVSAKTGLHIKELLDLILLVEDLHPKSRSHTSLFKAVIIESRLDQKAGPKATLIVKDGMVKLRDELEAGGIFAKVRTFIDPDGKPVQQAQIGDAVEVLGFEKVPQVGEIVYKKGEAALSSTLSQKLEEQKQVLHKDESKLALILCTDTQGSLEAITHALPLEDLHVVTAKTGEISEADVLTAKSVGAIVLGFNTKIRNEVAKLASDEKILLKNYTIIYELIDELSDVIEGKQLAMEEKIYGKAQILASFPFEKTTVLGIRVLEGRVARGDKVRLMQKDQIKGESTIGSLRHGKEQVSKIEAGKEAGVILSPFLDFTIGGVLICHS